MPHIIEWFNKSDERLAGEMDIPDISVAELKKVFPDSLNDPTLQLYGYDIKENQAVFFKQYVDICFEFDKYDYQFAYYRDV